MNFDKATGEIAPTQLPLQFVNIEIIPLVGGKYLVALQATLLDEQELEFVGQDLAHAHVDTLDEALALVRMNVTALNALPSAVSA